MNVWNVQEPHARYIRATVIFKGCIITAIHSAIHRSCDGYNLGIGGDTIKPYDGSALVSMRVVDGELHTVFRNNPCDRDTTGKYPAGGDPVDGSAFLLKLLANECSRARKWASGQRTLRRTCFSLAWPPT